jgi:hypothetical protein
MGGNGSEAFEVVEEDLDQESLGVQLPARWAMPIMRWTKFNATRSPIRMDRARPRTVHSVVPSPTRSPSAATRSTTRLGSIARKTCSNTAPPHATIAPRATALARAMASASMHASVVRSPPARSSCSARATRSATLPNGTS